MKFKHKLAGQPYRLARHLTGPIENDPELLIALMGAGYTAALNLAAPFGLIQSGVRGERYFAGLSIGKSTLGFPMPLFNYVTPASRAERIGHGLGSWLGGTIGRKGIPFHIIYDAGRAQSKIGAKIGSRVGGRLIPGVGWALLAYDVYDVAVNRSLWGFDLD